LTRQSEHGKITWWQNRESSLPAKALPKAWQAGTLSSPTNKK